MVSRGFFGRRRSQPTRSIPPGQYLERGFPVLSAGPTPRPALSEWTFRLEHERDTLAQWSWDEIQALCQSEINVDIHCVTKWTKLDTVWKGVTIDTLLEDAGLDPPEDYVIAFSDGGYTTNLPVEDLVDRKGMVGNEMFVIINGKAEVCVNSGGQSRRVRELKRGDVVGEMGLIRRHERTADVIATEDTEVMAMDERSWWRMWCCCPPF